MRKLHNLRLQEKKIIDDGMFFRPGKSETEMLKFAVWLWKRVRNYEREAKGIDFWNGVVKYEYYNAFMRRISSFGFACISFSAEGLMSWKKMLGCEGKVMDEVAEYFPILEDCTEFEFFCKSLCKTAELLDFQKYIDWIYNRYSMVLERFESCRLNLEKLSDQEFGKLNVFLKSVKDVANALWEDCEIREKIDEFKKQKEMVSGELKVKEDDLRYFEIWQKRLPKLAIVTYDESGKIVSARPNLEKDKEDVDLGVWSYNKFRFVSVEVEKLRNTKTYFETKITELEAKLHIKDFKLNGDVHEFRRYGVCLKFFWYLNTLWIPENDLKNTFKEEYDSIVEIFMKRHCDSFDGAVMNGFRKSKNVIHAGKVITKESFLNMENKTGNTTLFNMNFMLGDESNTINQIKFMPDDEEFEPINQIDFVNKSALK